MYRYAIYCTEEQTRKALELGAPIITISEPLYNHPTCGRDWAKVGVQGNSYSARIPTAEQMIGWLEEQGLFIEVDFLWEGTFSYGFWDIAKQKPLKIMRDLPRKEATLAAIDAALDYLSKTIKK